MPARPEIRGVRGVRGVGAEVDIEFGLPNRAMLLFPFGEHLDGGCANVNPCFLSVTCRFMPARDLISYCEYNTLRN